MNTFGKSARTLFTAIACAGVMGWAHGATLSLSFSDPVGDTTGSVDVTGMSFVFNNVTGDYTIRLAASAALPFNGNFRVNINLFNPDTGTTAQDPSHFADHFNDFDLGLETLESIVLTGTNARLLSWDEGDRVAISSTGGLGSFDGAPGGFNSSLSGLSGVVIGTERIGLAGNDPSALSEVALIASVSPEGAVPEPGSLALTGLALAALVGSARGQRSTKP